ncbi:MAG: cytochrome c biogenesis protein CcdA [bacterium]|nr:cytochrome c biogenesis protein CcdA [bacterium]
MPEFQVLLLPAFIAGLVTFLAPCTLPLVPAYLGFISGVASGREQLSSFARRKKILINGIAYIAGFSIIFILFGVLAGFLGSTILGSSRIWLARIGGALVIFFGLFLLGVIKTSSLAGAHSFGLGRWFRPGNPLSSLLVGATFAFGWTPCVGPVLGSVLILAGAKTTAFEGGLLLLIFSFGLAIPFLAVSLLYSRALRWIEKSQKTLRIISWIAGAFLILIGVFLLFDKFPLLISWGFRLLEPLNYEKSLLDFL